LYVHITTMWSFTHDVSNSSCISVFIKQSQVQNHVQIGDHDFPVLTISLRTHNY